MCLLLQSIINIGPACGKGIRVLSRRKWARACGLGLRVESIPSKGFCAAGRRDIQFTYKAWFREARTKGHRYGGKKLKTSKPYRIK